MGAKRVATKVAYMGLLFALAMILSVVESAVPVFIPIPGIRLGLSNVVVLYSVFLLGAGSAYTLTVLKALFVFLTRGLIASSLSLCGGLLSVTVMLLLTRLCGGKLSYSLCSMAGAVFHNMGQLAAAAVILGVGQIMLYYLPVLVLSGIVMGFLTAALIKVLMPYFSRFPVSRE